MDPVITVILYALFYMGGALGMLFFTLTLCDCYGVIEGEVQRNRRIAFGSALSVLFMVTMAASMCGAVWAFFPTFAYALYQLFAPMRYKAPMLLD